MRGAERGRTARIDLTNPVERDHPLNEGLVSWWMWLNGRLGNTLYDLAGRNHGTLTNGPTCAAGPNGFGAVNLDGSDDYIDCGTRLSLAGANQSFTLVLWMRWVNGSGYVSFWDKGASSSSRPWQWFFNQDSGGYLRFQQFNGSTNPTADTTTLNNDGKYHLFTAVRDCNASVLKQYADGRDVTTGASNVGFATSFEDGSSNAIGMPRNGITNYLNGTVGAAWAYNRALSASDIWSLYDQTLRGHPDTLRRFTPRVWSFGGGGGADVTIALTGLSATVSRGTLTPSSDYALTGQGATATPGTLTDVVSYALTGQALATAAGTLAPASTVPLTGQAATVSPGTLTPTSTLALTGNSATATQGTLTNVAAFALAGQAATASPGTLAPSSAYTLTGRSATVSPGTLAPASSVPLTGQSVTVSQGVLTPPGDVTIALTGLALTTAQGTLAPSSSQALTGQAATTAQGALAAAIAQALSGQALTVSQGTLTAPSTSGGGVRATATATNRVQGTAVALDRVAATGTAFDRAKGTGEALGG